MENTVEPESDTPQECLPITPRTTIADLPQEVIEKILSDRTIGARDLSSFGQTCSLFLINLDSWSMWREKFKQRWPKKFHLITKYLSKNQPEREINWKAIYKFRILVKQTVITRVLEIGHRSYQELDKYQLALNENMVYTFPATECPKVVAEAGLTAYKRLRHSFVLDELREIVNTGTIFENMTQKFYAERSLCCLRHTELVYIIDGWLIGKTCDLDLEAGATHIAQWMQPNEGFTVEDIKAQLDGLAYQVRVVLRGSNPDHPALSSDTSASLPLSHTATESIWSSSDCRAIIAAIEVVTKRLFNIDFERFQHPNKSYINCVLKDRQAIPISLCLVVAGIARRLGVILEPVSYPETFILRWLEYPLRHGIARYTFVDPFNGNYSLSSSELPEKERWDDLESVASSCSKHEVLQRMLRNLIHTWRCAMTQDKQRQMMLRHVSELQCLLHPGQYNHVLLMVQLLLLLRVNLRWALALIQDLKERFPAHAGSINDIPVKIKAVLDRLKEEEGEREPVVVKHRADYPQVKLSVGLVCLHKKFNYRCVIAGWDDTCKASEMWIEQMGVDNLPNGRQQPFYHVWAQDGSDRYVGEENLVIAVIPGPVQLRKVGRIFESFNGRYYVANSYLAADYPDDMECTVQLLNDFVRTLEGQALDDWLRVGHVIDTTE